jgi:hypothetical protein
VTAPQDQRGELLAVYVDSRTVSDPQVVVYSLTKDEWRVEHHRRLMWHTRRASPIERAEAMEVLARMGEVVRILQAAPPVIVKADRPDEVHAAGRKRGK